MNTLTTLNNRLLSYVQDDIEMPILTQNLMLYKKLFMYQLGKTEIPPNDVEQNSSRNVRIKYLRDGKTNICEI